MSETEPVDSRAGASYQALIEMAFMPMLVSANWWTSALESWCPHVRAGAAHHGVHELEVPDPVQREGEHALFA